MLDPSDLGGIPAPRGAGRIRRVSGWKPRDDDAIVKNPTRCAARGCHAERVAQDGFERFKCLKCGYRWARGHTMRRALEKAGVDFEELRREYERALRESEEDGK